MNKTKLAITLILFMLLSSIKVIADGPVWEKKSEFLDVGYREDEVLLNFKNVRHTVEDEIDATLSKSYYEKLEEKLITINPIAITFDYSGEHCYVAWREDNNLYNNKEYYGFVYEVFYDQDGKKEMDKLTGIEKDSTEESQTKLEITEYNSDGTVSYKAEYYEDGSIRNEWDYEAGIFYKEPETEPEYTLSLEEEKSDLRAAIKEDIARGDGNLDKTEEVIDKIIPPSLEEEKSDLRAAIKEDIARGDGNLDKTEEVIDKIYSKPDWEQIEELDLMRIENLKALQEKESFLNHLDILTDKYKEGGKEALSPEDLDWLRGAGDKAEIYIKELDEDQIGVIEKISLMDNLDFLLDKYKKWADGEGPELTEAEKQYLKDAEWELGKFNTMIYGNDKITSIYELSYEQRTVIDYARQTAAKVFYDSVRAARGGIALSNLLNSWLDWDFMMKWREKSDEFFSQTVIGRIISGRWEESICHGNLDSIPNSVAVVNVNGVMGFAAHVEGERSKAIITNNQTFYFYKITFAVNPPIDSEEKIQFELLIDGKRADIDNDGRADKKELNAGENYIGAGENAVVRYKDKIYKEVCLKFYNTENLNNEFKGSLKDHMLCNNIVVLDIKQSDISKPAQTTTGSGTTAASDAW
ncbi:MAG: hypothetical protein PHV16_00470 [Candidatus Nanoarchaeia archaeon]|nr:hypothetical protein [Candidatus Nanoarchaeia archaeon]